MLVSVRYALDFHGEILDRYDFTDGQGRIEQLIEKADRNPGMKIIAEVYRPETADDEEVVTIRSVVYP